MKISDLSVRPVAAALCFLGFLTASIAAYASGWPPFVADDQIIVAQGGTTSVLSSGATSVLANDFDLERDRLTAELDGNVKHGELLFNSDGTFVYSHDGKNKKNDEFSYRAFDGTRFSRRGRVKIEIIESDNAPPVVLGTPPDQEVVEGAPYSLSLTEYFNDPDGDTLQYSASGLPRSGNLAINSSSGRLSGTPRAADSRDNAYSVTITATDPGGLRASVNFRLQIFADDRADLAVTASIATNPVTVGENAQWSIVVENLGPSDLGEGELAVRWTTSGAALALSAPQECTVSSNNSSTPAIRCVLNGMLARTQRVFSVLGTQSEDGDNSLIATVTSDDPVSGNNGFLRSAQVVAEFSEGPSQILPVSASSVASGDLNGDEQPDVVVTSNQTIIYFNNGARSVITPGTSLGADSGGTAVAILDWNGDGNSDVAVAGMATRVGRIYLNDGSGNFGQSVNLDYQNAGTTFAVASADFAQDGFADLVVVGSGGSRLLRSTGGSGFSLTSLGAGPGIDVSTADLNRDTYSDIMIVESSNRSVALLQNSGDGRNFSTRRLQRGSVASVTGADLNGNGRIDLLLAIDGDDLSPPESRILYHRSDGSFPSGETIGASPLSKMLAGDVDGDELVDIVAVNEAGVHQLYLGSASGEFILDEEQIVSSGMRRGVLLDFNKDQSLDLILAGPKSNVVEIHANNGIGRLGLGDRLAPVIVLNGEINTIIPAGSIYEELGAVATDDIDGDLTDALVTVGSFDTAVVGTYTLDYSVADRAGNLATVTRIIQVGVNQGPGGGGGGKISLLLLALLTLLLISASKRRFGQSRVIQGR